MQAHTNMPHTHTHTQKHMTEQHFWVKHGTLWIIITHLLPDILYSMAMLSGVISMKWYMSSIPDLSNWYLFHTAIEWLQFPCSHPLLHNGEQINFSVWKQKSLDYDPMANRNALLHNILFNDQFNTCNTIYWNSIVTILTSVNELTLAPLDNEKFTIWQFPLHDAKWSALRLSCKSNHVFI